MIITPTGRNLHILIPCDYSIYSDWSTFTTWYSITRNLPDATVSIICSRPLDRKSGHFNWAYRMSVGFMQYSNIVNEYNNKYLNQLYAFYVADLVKLITLPCMVLGPHLIALRSLSRGILSQLNDSNVTSLFSPYMMYFKYPFGERFDLLLNTCDSVSSLHDEVGFMTNLANSMQNVISNDDLCDDCRSDNMSTFASYNTSCGKLVTKNWIDNHKESPLRHVASLAKGKKMSMNEAEIFKLWNKAHAVYDVVR